MRLHCLSWTHFGFSLSLRGRTIIFSIHQPRYSIFKHFDQLMLLSEGKTIYHGPAKEALGYFRDIGWSCHTSACVRGNCLSKILGVQRFPSILVQLMMPSDHDESVKPAWPCSFPLPVSSYLPIRYSFKRCEDKFPLISGIHTFLKICVMCQRFWDHHDQCNLHSWYLSYNQISWLKQVTAVKLATTQQISSSMLFSEKLREQHNMKNWMMSFKEVSLRCSQWKTHSLKRSFLRWRPSVWTRNQRKTD